MWRLGQDEIVRFFYSPSRRTTAHFCEQKVKTIYKEPLLITTTQITSLNRRIQMDKLIITYLLPNVSPMIQKV